MRNKFARKATMFVTALSLLWSNQMLYTDCYAEDVASNEIVLAEENGEQTPQYSIDIVVDTVEMI